MPPNTSLAGLTKWLGRHEWRESFKEILWLHLGPACERAGITFDDIAGILGQHAFTREHKDLWGVHAAAAGAEPAASLASPRCQLHEQGPGA